MLGELLLLAAISLISYAFYKWATLNNNYFEMRNIKYMKPRFLVGNTGGFFLNKYTVFDFAKKMYNTFPDEPIFGMFDFRVPRYVIRDPDAIKQIAVKDFDFFVDHQTFADDKTDNLFGNNLLHMKGEKWRQMRATLSPAFTGSKMRQMFELVTDCGEDLVNHFQTKVEYGEKISIEMKEFFTRYTNDVIGSCAFGLKVNSFEQPENEFYIRAKTLMKFNGFKAVMRLLLVTKLPAIARALNISLSGPFQNLFKQTILYTMEVRKKNKIIRPDMIHMLMQIRDGTLKSQTNKIEKEKEGFATVQESEIGKKTVKRSWNDDDLVAQCFVFFVAGFETTATVLTFTSYELARNLDIQQKLYEEIVETNEQLDGKRINYETLQKMKYLDQVICESLRLWTPSAQIDRVCVKDYVYDHGGLKFKIEKGKQIIFTTYGIHHNPKYYVDPERFDPDRFSDENKHNIMPGTYLPFGVGPRNCIGSRFALMEVKCILYHLLLSFSLEPNDKTEIPIKLQKSPFTLNPENGFHLELKPRSK